MKNYILLLSLSLLLIACSKDKDELKPLDAVITYGEMTDERDGNVYKTIQINDQIWMVENLRYRLPGGSLDGCYTFGEATINWAQLAVDKQLFTDSVNMAITKGEIVNPPDLPIAQQPIFIINMFMGLMTPSQLMERLVGFPEIVSVLDRINENLKIPASFVSAQNNLTNAESENGGYAAHFGYLYTHQALDKIAPEGWRIPTDEDWMKLESAVGMTTGDLDNLNQWRGSISRRLIQGTEQAIGFDAQLGGARVYGSFLYGTPFINRAISGYYWSSTLVQESDSTQLGIVRQFMLDNNALWRGTSRREAAYHIRCIKNN